ncbi:MAG: hypothetical protein V4555_18665 [Acidobacteriota bacterium]
MAQGAEQSKEEVEKLQRLHENFGMNSITRPYGIGVGFRGRSFASEADREAKIELRTRWIVFLWVPLIPLGSYRIRRLKPVISARGKLARKFELISQERLCWRQVLRMWAIAAAAVVALVALMKVFDLW